MKDFVSRQIAPKCQKMPLKGGCPKRKTNAKHNQEEATRQNKEDNVNAAFNEREKHISIRTPCGGNEKVLTFSTNYVIVWGL